MRTRAIGFVIAYIRFLRDLIAREYEENIRFPDYHRA